MRHTTVFRSLSTPWSYRKGSTLLHRLPAGFKLVFLLLLSLAAFFPGTEIRCLALLFGIVFILVILSLAAGIYPWELLRGSVFLLLIVLAVFVFQALEFSPLGINRKGLLQSVIFCGRIAAAFAAGSLLFAVTTPGEIRKSLSRAEAFLHLERLHLSLAISLMLGFLPRFFEIWEETNLAWKSRAGKNSLSRLTILIPLVLEKMIVKAAETASAMQARNGT